MVLGKRLILMSDTLQSESYHIFMSGDLELIYNQAPSSSG